MALASVLAILAERGLSLKLGPDRQPLLVGPRVEVTPPLLEAVKAYREEIIAHLEKHADAPQTGKGPVRQTPQVPSPATNDVFVPAPWAPRNVPPGTVGHQHGWHCFDGKKWAWFMPQEGRTA
jgi:hypothetical protein